MPTADRRVEAGRRLAAGGLVTGSGTALGALAASVVDGLADRSAVLMRNHGSVAHGESVEQACERLELVEWLSDVYARAAALGTPRLLDDAEPAAAKDTFTRVNYGRRSYTPGC